MLTFVLLLLIAQFGVGVKFLQQGDKPQCSPNPDGKAPLRPQCKVFARRQMLPIANCQMFDAANQTCHRCLPNFNLRNNLCFTSPESGIEAPSHLAYGGLLDKFTIDPKEIKFSRNPNCLTFVDNFLNDCLVCMAGFQLRDKDCYKEENIIAPIQRFQKLVTPQILNKYDMCQVINVDGTCQKCYQGATFQKGQCRFINTHKQNCIFSPESCYPVRTQCDIYSKNGICKTCHSNATLQDGQCVIKTIQNLCLMQDQKAKTCANCSKYANNQNGKCVYKQPGCQAFNGLMCIACEAGFSLLGVSCFRSSDLLYKYEEKNCISWRNGQCIQCNVGYTVDSSGSCLPLKV